jgi:ketosteroid isomerase-like protein
MNAEIKNSSARTVWGLALVGLTLLVLSCAPKVDAPADIQAIKDTQPAFDRAWNAGNPEQVVSGFYTADAVRMDPFQPALVGQNAIRSSLQRFFDTFTSEGRNVAGEVRVSGDLAVARGTYEGKTSLKAGGYSIKERGKWVTAFERQADGSWKSFWDIYNSDRPVADILPLGAEEQALLQIEREWTDAEIKKDVAWFEKTLADGWATNADGQITQKAQLLSGLKSSSRKVLSVSLEGMRALVLGETAVVHGLATTTSSDKGKETSVQVRWTDIFIKRDGRWRCVSGYTTKVI